MKFKDFYQKYQKNILKAQKEIFDINKDCDFKKIDLSKDKVSDNITIIEL